MPYLGTWTLREASKKLEMRVQGSGFRVADLGFKVLVLSHYHAPRTSRCPVVPIEVCMVQGGGVL